MSDPDATLAAIRARAAAQELRVTQHALQAMADEGILLDHVLHAIASGRIIEDYPDHRRGACCLLHGSDQGGRDIHVVCTTAQPTLIIITVYVPAPPKWVSATQRRTTP